MTGWGRLSPEQQQDVVGTTNNAKMAVSLTYALYTLKVMTPGIKVGSNGIKSEVEAEQNRKAARSRLREQLAKKNVALDYLPGDGGRRGKLSFARGCHSVHAVGGILCAMWCGESRFRIEFESSSLSFTTQSK